MSLEAQTMIHPGPPPQLASLLVQISLRGMGAVVFLRSNIVAVERREIRRPECCCSGCLRADERKGAMRLDPCNPASCVWRPPNFPGGTSKSVGVREQWHPHLALLAG